MQVGRLVGCCGVLVLVLMMLTKQLHDYPIPSRSGRGMFILCRLDKATRRWNYVAHRYVSFYLWSAVVMCASIVHQRF